MNYSIEKSSDNILLAKAQKTFPPSGNRQTYMQIPRSMVSHANYEI